MASAYSRKVAPPPIETPCVKVCVVDPVSGLCIGCRRSLAEIAGWSTLTDEQRREIMTAVQSRQVTS